MYIKHGMTKSPEYQVWRNILIRCFNPKARMYPRYGGRGITICDEWRNSFQAFFDHVGRRPSNKHSIDRIDNNGNYEPGNVRWVERKQQQQNISTNTNIDIDGKRICLREAARQYGIPYSTLEARIAQVCATVGCPHEGNGEG